MRKRRPQSPHQELLIAPEGIEIRIRTQSTRLLKDF